MQKYAITIKYAVICQKKSPLEFVKITDKNPKNVKRKNYTIV